VRLHIFLVLGVMSRFILFSVPNDFYDYILVNKLWLPQVCLDLLPELIFWQTYVLLVLLWAAMYYGANNMNKDHALQLVFVVVSISSFFAGFLIAGIMQLAHPQTFPIIVEAIFLSVLAVGAVIAFAIFGILLYTRTKKLPLHPPTRKDSMLTKIKWIVAAITICDMTHCFFLIFVDTIEEYNRPKYFEFIWLVYFVMTEITPAAVILFIFKKIPEKGHPYSALNNPRY